MTLVVLVLGLVVGVLVGLLGIVRLMGRRRRALIPWSPLTGSPREAA